MSLLLLGGTADGRHLAQTLYQRNIDVIYSVAGLVRKPKVDCEVISGGFSQYGGLSAFIQQREITAILDATHPYAQTMSNTAVESAQKHAIPCWRFHRAEWKPIEGDQWFECESFAEVLTILKTKKSVFLSAGQLTQEQVDELVLNNPSQKQLLRTAAEPQVTLAPSMQWVKAIGPFSYDNEIELLQKNTIDIVLSKKSGGEATVAKLQAARELAIPVIMLQRPQVIPADQHFESLSECEQFIAKAFAINSQQTS